jgi:hypothetical protein
MIQELEYVAAKAKSKAAGTAAQAGIVHDAIIST